MTNQPLPPKFDLAAFSRIANHPSHNPEDFARMNHYGPLLAPVFYKKFGEGERCACLIQRNSPILMVAHVDTVLQVDGRAPVLDGNRLFHPGMDNRMGVYLGLEVIPAMNLHVDLLLTTDEEQGASTSALVRTRKRYKWIFSFDRKGDDVVCYQYDNPELYRILTDSGFSVGQGSYSCITEMEHMECCGINFGCGMADYHSDSAYCDLLQLTQQLQRFSQFYGQYADLWFPHTPAGQQSRRTIGHPWAENAESILWQYEFHRSNGSTAAADKAKEHLWKLLSYSPELRGVLAAEMAQFPELIPELPVRT